MADSTPESAGAPRTSEGRRDTSGPEKGLARLHALIATLDSVRAQAEELCREVTQQLSRLHRDDARPQDEEDRPGRRATPAEDREP